MTITLLLVGVLAGCTAPESSVESVQDPTPIEVVENRRLDSLPSNVRDRVVELFEGELPAEQGAPFNATDVIDQTNPRRRLVFWVRDNKLGHYILHYEHGGIGRHSHVIGLIKTQQSAIPIFNISLRGAHPSLKELRQAVSTLDLSTSGGHY